MAVNGDTTNGHAALNGDTDKHTSSFEKVESLLAKHGQSHLLKLYPSLSPEDQRALLQDIANVSFDDIHNFHKQRQTQPSPDITSEDLSPVDPAVCGSVHDPEYDSYWQSGLEAISRSSVCVVLLAGGQGTRLGVSYPKGMYDVGLPSHKSLYHLQAERILKVQSLASQTCGDGKPCTVMWYIMTSEHTKGSTEAFFAKHSYFGLEPSNVVFFEQEMIPCLDFEGRILLDQPQKISRAPNGNGGLYAALGRQGVLSDMLSRGIEHVHVYGVDNILVRVADPAFLGFCRTKGADCGNKALPKGDPHEKVGVVCRVGNVYRVVEYSEISKEIAELRDETGKLVYDASNIVNHYFTTDFLKRVVERESEDLIYHIAKKKIPYMDVDTNTRIEPKIESGIKREKFVFDVFTLSKSFAVFAVERSEEFSPLKNADSAPGDNPRTARQAICGLHASWVSKAGGTINAGSNEASEAIDAIVCEISPLVSYKGEGLESLCSGKDFTSPVTLS